MAVFGLRSGDPELIKVGLTAVAAIDAKRVDYRDLLLALSLIHHSAERHGLNVRSLFEETASLATANTAELITRFWRRPPERKSLRRSWGYDEVVTPEGRGFIRWSFKPYQPSYDLTLLALRVAKAITSDRYKADSDSISIATEIPSAWFTAEHAVNKEIPDSPLRTIKGAATVNAKLRPEYHARHDAQQFTVFLAECSSDSNSAALRSLVRPNSQDCTTLSIVEGPLFALLVARSFMGGVESYETSDTLEPFRAPLTNLLHRACRPE
jgi:hypothetical protein